MERVRLSDVRDEAIALAEAIALLERRYPDHELVLAPKGDKTDVHVTRKNGALPRRKQSIRERVFSAATGEWRSVRELCELASVNKEQARGVLNAKDARELFERKDQPDGSKLYRLRPE